MTDKDREEILRLSDEEVKEASNGWQHIYREAVNDLDFVYDPSGYGQWDEKVRNERNADQRPMITSNKLLKFVRKMRGEGMINRPRIKTIPIDNKADPIKAELFNGLIRQIEYKSTADIVYDTAYGHAIAGGVGYFRIVTEYSDDRSFNQDIKLKRVLNPFTVKFDPSAIEFMHEDAKYCYIEGNIPTEQFKKKYPSAQTVGFGGGDATGQEWSNWYQTDHIKVAERFYKVPVKKKIAELNTGEIIELTKDITTEFLYTKGLRVVREREVDSHKIMWLKRSGNEILEEPTEWAGKYIPIVPVFGDEIVINGKKYLLSLIRGAKGLSQMNNYWITKATETVALAPLNPYMVDHRQIKGFEPEWLDMYKKPRPFVRYNAIAGIDKPQKEQQTPIPTAIISMIQNTAYDIEDHLGMYQASKGEASNERSGKAIMARAQQSDKGTYTFVNNFSRSIVYGGKQIIDLIPKIYDTHRALSIQGEDGNQHAVEVNKPIMNMDGSVGVENDLSVGEFDVIATVGMTNNSKREEMVGFMVQTMQYTPMLAPILAPLIFKYSDWDGAQEIYGELKAEMSRMQQAQSVQAAAPSAQDIGGGGIPPEMMVQGRG